MPLLLLFVILPIVEIFVFVQVGSIIGAWWVVALVIAAALAGGWLIRRQGQRAVLNLQASLNAMRDPARPMAHSAIIMLAGLLLIVPGFVTDAAALLLLIPPVRDLILRGLGRRVVVMRTGFAARDPRDGARDGIIDAEFEVVDPDAPALPHGTGPATPPRPGHPPSGWTRD